MIRDVTGLNEARDGSAPDKNALVGVQKLAAANSNTATRHILQAGLQLTQEVGCNWWALSSTCGMPSAMTWLTPLSWPRLTRGETSSSWPSAPSTCWNTCRKVANLERSWTVKLTRLKTKSLNLIRKREPSSLKIKVSLAMFKSKMRHQPLKIPLVKKSSSKIRRELPSGSSRSLSST